MEAHAGHILYRLHHSKAENRNELYAYEAMWESGVSHTVFFVFSAVAQSISDIIDANPMTFPSSLSHLSLTQHNHLARRAKSLLRILPW